MLTIHQHDHVQTLRECAMPLLLERECENCVIIGILERLAEGKPATRSGVATTPLLLSIHDGREVRAVATQTPPHALLFSPMDEACARALVEHLHERGWGGREFSGILPAVQTIARGWQELTKLDYHRHLGLRLYQSSRVIDPPPAAGALRQAAVEDLELATEWIDAFGREIHEPFPDPRRTAQLAVEEQRLYLWVDEGEPRACCAWQGPTPHSIRIGLVYTPPQFRGRGYASNGVARLTRQLLDLGRSFCTLFTDISNPTSNNIYQKIGYQPVAEFEHLRFAAPGDSG